jgi:hypothetical protein
MAFDYLLISLFDPLFGRLVGLINRSRDNFLHYSLRGELFASTSRTNTRARG